VPECPLVAWYLAYNQLSQLSAKWFRGLNREILSVNSVIPKTFCLFSVTERNYARSKLCDIRIIFFISINKQVVTMCIEAPRIFPCFSSDVLIAWFLAWYWGKAKRTQIVERNRFTGINGLRNPYLSRCAMRCMYMFQNWVNLSSIDITCHT
jgi:hypothetical protein